MNLSIINILSLFVAIIFGTYQIISNAGPKLFYWQTGRFRIPSRNNQGKVVITYTIYNTGLFKHANDIYFTVEGKCSIIKPYPMKAHQPYGENGIKIETLEPRECVNIQIMGINPNPSDTYLPLLECKNAKRKYFERSAFPIFSVWQKIGLSLLSIIGFYYLLNRFLILLYSLFAKSSNMA
jgi:hypothetical protein